MRKLSILFIISLAALFAFGLGCSEADYVAAPADSEGELTAYPIDQPWSGLIDIVDLNGLPEDITSTDHLLGPEADPPDVSDTSWDVYAVTLVWGDFKHHTDQVTTPIDWSGTLGVNGVAWVLPMRAIAFEDNDMILENVSEAEAAWQSTTHGDYDGINFLVFMKRGINYFVEPSLTFNTEAINIAWPTGSLHRLNSYYHVGDHATLGIHAHQIKRVHCPKGMLAGHWIKSDSHAGTGHLEGVWLDSHNQPIGLYAGRFWLADDGRGHFSGTVSGYVTDEVIAEFEGVWHYNDPALCPTCGERAGLYKGRLKWLNHDVGGTIWGAFGSLDFANDHKLPMAGVWRVNCQSGISNLTD